MKTVELIGPFTTAGKTVATLSVNADKLVEYSVSDGILVVQATDAQSGEIITGVAHASQAALDSLNAAPNRASSEELHFPSAY